MKLNRSYFFFFLFSCCFFFGPSLATLAAALAPVPIAESKISELKKSWTELKEKEKDRSLSLEQLLTKAETAYYLFQLQANQGTEKSGNALDLLDEGEEAAEDALKINPQHPYALLLWTALAGTYAGLKKNLFSLMTISQLVKRLQLLKKVDEKFYHFAADRGLGLIYLNAPAVISVGSLKKAETHLKFAYEKAPQYPGNSLSYAATLVQSLPTKKTVLKNPSQFNEANKKYQTITKLLELAKKDRVLVEYQFDEITWQKMNQEMEEKLIKLGWRDGATLQATTP